MKNGFPTILSDMTGLSSLNKIDVFSQPLENAAFLKISRYYIKKKFDNN